MNWSYFSAGVIDTVYFLFCVSLHCINMSEEFGLIFIIIEKL